MGRAPVRATQIREPVEAAKPAHGKTRLRKNASARSMLDLPAEIVDMVRKQYGQALQWVTDSVHGKAEPAVRQGFEINAWEPVTPDMFGGIFDGMYTRKGHKGEIEYGGLILMYRPLELNEEAVLEERQTRDGAMEAQRAMIVNGDIPGLSVGYDSQHPKALASNTFVRTVRPPQEIPKD